MGHVSCSRGQEGGRDRGDFRDDEEITMGEYRSTQRRGNSQKTAAAKREPGTAIQLSSMVDERPWWMLAAAAGAGLVLGAQSRRLAQSRVAEMLLATLGGVAVRVATGALAQWLEAQRER
jgi:ElaB/YqjD/DUF883 family membrane-anchored ribosome-binding protein